MSEVNIDKLAAQVEALMTVVTTLVENQQAAPVQKPKQSANDVFTAKYTTQLKKAKRLAKNKGTRTKLVYVDGKSVWYMAESRSNPKNSTLLATVSPEGTVKAEVTGLPS